MIFPFFSCSAQPTTIELTMMGCKQIGKHCYVTGNNALNATCPNMLRVCHSLKTILDALVELSPRKMQPIPINRHFVVDVTLFLAAVFCHSKLIPRLSAINA